VEPDEQISATVFIAIASVSLHHVVNNTNRDAVLSVIGNKNTKHFPPLQRFWILYKGR